MLINLKHLQTGVVKQCKLGFSWTTFFFGFFVPLFRGDMKWLGIMLAFELIVIIIAVLTLGFGGVLGVLFLVFPFIYNKHYIKDLMEKGYIPADQRSSDVLKGQGLYVENKVEKAETT